MKLNTSGKYKTVRMNGKDVLEHRVIMHSIDPRDNEDDLVVHHIDGNKSNNDPSNLVWMTKHDHNRLHRLGENHFACSGKDNANYRHGMCVGGYSKEYKKYHAHKNYLKHREERLAKQKAYSAQHREHKKWYDKVRHWTKQLAIADSEERKNECLFKLKELKENAV